MLVFNVCDDVSINDDILFWIDEVCSVLYICTCTFSWPSHIVLTLCTCSIGWPLGHVHVHVQFVFIRSASYAGVLVDDM